MLRKSRKHPDIPPVYPGEVIREDALPELGISKTAFAKALGVSRNTLHLLLEGKIGVSAEMAVRLAHVIGSTPEHWLNLQMAHDLEIARKKVDTKALTKLWPLDEKAQAAE